MSKFGSMALAVDKPQRMTILHPVTRQPLRDAEGKEAFLDLLSGDSDAARDYDREATKRRLNVRGRTKITVQEVEADVIGRLAALTSGWLLLGLDGVPLDVPCNPGNARELYAEPAMGWLREQAEEFIGDRGNFLKASSKS